MKPPTKLREAVSAAGRVATNARQSDIAQTTGAVSEDEPSPVSPGVVLGLRSVPLRIVGFVVLAVAGALFWRVGSSAYVYEADVALYSAIGALGLNLLTGYAGQVSIGNAAFLAIGGYTVVFLGPQVPFPVPIIVGAVAAGIVGFIIGLPSLRLRGLYLIFSTLALQYLVSFAFDQYDSSTGAIAGHFITAPSLGFATLDNSRSWFVVLVIAVLLVALFVWNLARGRPGRAWGALRQNETAAAVMGVNVTRSKLVAFTASSTIIGLAGGIGAYFLQEVSVSYYSIDLAVSYIAMILIGGLASIPGSIIGATIVTMIPFILSSTASGSGSEGGFLQHNLSSIETGIYGFAILIFLYFRPAGIASLFRSRVRAVGRTVSKNSTAVGDGSGD
jgi:branched-chain amino acid transport system permease protein